MLADVRPVQTWRAHLGGPSLWLIVIAVANGLDILTTTIGLHLGIEESNPIMRATLLGHGELAMYALKLLLVAIAVAVVRLVQDRYRHAWVFFAAMAFLPSLVVFNNLYVVLSRVA